MQKVSIIIAIYLTLFFGISSLSALFHGLGVHMTGRVVHECCQLHLYICQ